MSDVRYCQHPNGCRNFATNGWFCDEHRTSRKAKRAANPKKGDSFVSGKNTLARAPGKRSGRRRHKPG